MSSAADTHEHNPHLAHHFETIEQQEEAQSMGMWLFLAQEFMFFGGLFCAYAVWRFTYHDAWFEGSSHLSTFWGGLNTIVLLLSSYTMAMGVYYCQIGDTKRLTNRLIMTLGLGIVFVAVKLQFEWFPKFHDGVVPGQWWGPAGHYADMAAFPEQGHLQLFYFLYYVMTGMHAFHMLIGFGILIPLIVMSAMGKFGPQRFMAILNFGLYWHFVDIVWVFLFPMFYLVT
ncbi:MAG: cytochrome c oxidase subunit 3 [Candidatus Hydrogenedentes bacterium]|nr:cytochrome c oxidase subunit 3 [Candidatus Hydrogenedentota bacterium]